MYIKFPKNQLFLTPAFPHLFGNFSLVSERKHLYVLHKKSPPLFCNTTEKYFFYRIMLAKKEKYYYDTINLETFPK